MCRVFATATRNYAKSQFHWYRKRHDFLWLDANHSAEQVLRQLDHSGAVSFRHLQVASDIEHWCRVPRDQYQMAIDMQVVCNFLSSWVWADVV